MVKVGRFLSLALFSFLILGFAACQEKDAGDHMEDAAESVGEAIEDVGDEVEDAVDDATDNK